MPYACAASTAVASHGAIGARPGKSLARVSLARSFVPMTKPASRLSAPRAVAAISAALRMARGVSIIAQSLIFGAAAIRANRGSGGKIIEPPSRVDTVDAHDHFPSAETAGRNSCHDLLAGRFLGGGRHRVLKIENDGIAGQSPGLFQGSRVGARHIEYAAAWTNGHGGIRVVWERGRLARASGLPSLLGLKAGGPSALPPVPVAWVKRQRNPAATAPPSSADSGFRLRSSRATAGGGIEPIRSGCKVCTSFSPPPPCPPQAGRVGRGRHDARVGRGSGRLQVGVGCGVRRAGPRGRPGPSRQAFHGYFRCARTARSGRRGHPDRAPGADRATRTRTGTRCKAASGRPAIVSVFGTVPRGNLCAGLPRSLPRGPGNLQPAQKSVKAALHDRTQDPRGG